MSETAEACPKCGAAVRTEYPTLTLWECYSKLKGAELTQSSECLERQLASLTARNAELEAGRENWHTMYRELYCAVWCATEEEFAEYESGDGLDHHGAVKEAERCNRSAALSPESPDAPA